MPGERQTAELMPASRTLHVLVVEDEPVLRFVLSELLTEEGVQVQVAKDGLTGLALAAETRPDVVLLDLLMPRLSGAEVVAALRADPETADLPVVLLTGNLAQRHFPPPGTYQGVVYKPFDARMLLETLRRAARRGELLGEAGAAG